MLVGDSVAMHDRVEVTRPVSWSFVELSHRVALLENAVRELKEVVQEMRDKSIPHPDQDDLWWGVR